MYIASKSGEGPIAYEAQLVHAVILKNAPLKRRPRCTYSGAGDTLRCHVVFELVDDDQPLTYDSPELKKVKKNSPLWVDDPEQQLWYYSVRAGARRHITDVIMGVYTPDEIRDSPQITGEAGVAITLGAAARAEGDAAEDADFTPVGVVIAKNAEKAKADRAAAAADKKKAAPKDGPQVGDGGATGEAPQQPKPEEAKPATAESSAPQQGPDPADDEDEAEDIALVTNVEAEEKTAKGPAKGKAIKAAKGALKRIAETGSAELGRRANALLNKYDLED
jgi:hypothetical protein